MRYLTAPALTFVLLATLLVSVAPNPLGVFGRLAAQGRHTYEVQIQNEPPFEIKADRIVHHPSGLVSLQDGELTVAAFTAYQLVYLVRTSERAERTFEVKTTDGTVREFWADDIHFDPSQMVRLEADGDLVGLIWNNNVRYVVATDARP